ncbi:hypothetical protein DL93DRAFT_1583479 [Clavulina sp. PMI_390]|nr:hypothetical protein DL93DRAFT_1583479 [Clavulina sp. PMI_390]
MSNTDIENDISFVHLISPKPRGWLHKQPFQPCHKHRQKSDVHISTVFMDKTVESFLTPSEPSSPTDHWRASRPASPSPSIRSTSSNIFVPNSGVIELSLADFCEYVNERSSLRKASILSIEGYRQRIGVIIHRFVVLALARHGQQGIWLRLDRRAEKGVSFLGLIRARGTTRANDRVSRSFGPRKIF